MTKDDQLDQFFENISYNDAQQKQHDIFHIVLVDIKSATQDEEIQCVEKPLMGDEDLEFVALSYRWGEIPEQTVDTEQGYLANITSFALHDFYGLCKMMIQEPDLKDMKYVWVDAICIDQANPVKRKATIHQMTTIYERANYIVAVPDLHRQHLVNINANGTQVNDYTLREATYFYHLIHGHADQLAKMDEEWFDQNGVPENQHIRQMLSKYTGRFADHIMAYKLHDGSDYLSRDILKDIWTASCLSYHVPKQGSGIWDWNKQNVIDRHDTNCLKCVDHDDPFAILNDLPIHPNELSDENKSSLVYHVHAVLKQVKHDEWKRCIAKRSQFIEQKMGFLTDLVKDWSSRVWVISEYNIAKNQKSKKMKYWFTHLNSLCHGPSDEQYLFFEFDFENHSVMFPDTSEASDICMMKHASSFHALTAKLNFTYQIFHDTMARQLAQKSFLAMMLQSMASKHEDRFYAILPISKYKNEIMNKKKAMNDIDSLIKVKLKLFDMMDTEDKLALLFLTASTSGSPANGAMALPTFATLPLLWAVTTMRNGLILADDDITGCNFDEHSTATLQLSHPSPGSNHRLHFKPITFSVCDAALDVNDAFERNKRLCRRVFKKACHEKMCLVLIPHCCGPTLRPDHRCLKSMDDSRKLTLYGSFEVNQWILVPYDGKYTFKSVDTKMANAYTGRHGVGFNIY